MCIRDSIRKETEKLSRLQEDQKTIAKETKDMFCMEVEGITYLEHAEAAQAVEDLLSVSYTHLDVYKRQDEGAIPKRARYHLGLMDMNVLNPGEFFDKLPETYIISVYYTHLDVYKRQLV